VLQKIRAARAFGKNGESSRGAKNHGIRKRKSQKRLEERERKNLHGARRKLLPETKRRDHPEERKEKKYKLEGRLNKRNIGSRLERSQKIQKISLPPKEAISLPCASERKRKSLKDR